MTAGRRGVALTPMETRRDIIVRAAQRADELGYEVFSVPEGWGMDSTLVLAEIALCTKRIRLLSGMLSVWGRTPATLAMNAATMHEISGGRYLLGLGASTRALAEGFHDVPFVQPAKKLAETVTRTRALLAGEPARLSQTEGGRPLRLGMPAAPGVPIWVAAMGEHTTRVAAQEADGWFPILLTGDYLASRASQLNEIRAAAGRPDPLTVAAGPLAVASDDPALGRAVAASYIAWYLTAMGDVYARSVASQGYAAEVSAIHAANPRPNPRRGVVPGEAEALLGEFAVWGPPGEVAAQLKRWDETVSVMMVGLAPGVPWEDLDATLVAAAP
jgi:alkanesulfonate monooxygenase SsuD/methylene tetrahydromethanopterin reductase-like flavin-dependent oxidoreductase (luciferase family)